MAKKQDQDIPSPLSDEMAGEVVKTQDVTEQMRKAYLDYAMSVITSRALPDVRDGLKPVHRRIIYAMHTKVIVASAKFQKSAKIVGEVIGNYHPHGDTAVYDTMVGMAQDFTYRYPLVWGQGNFGSLDGDAPAAYRYTEAKMQKVTAALLTDIGKRPSILLRTLTAHIESQLFCRQCCPMLC